MPLPFIIGGLAALGSAIGGVGAAAAGAAIGVAAAKKAIGTIDPIELEDLDVSEPFEDDAETFTFEDFAEFFKDL